MFKNKVRKGFTLLELIVVIVVLGILAALAVPTFSTVKDKSADSIALKNAQAVQRDFDAQSALATSDSSITPSASGTWTINGHTYSYTASAGSVPSVGGTVSKSGGSGNGGGAYNGTLASMVGMDAIVLRDAMKADGFKFYEPVIPAYNGLFNNADITDPALIGKFDKIMQIFPTYTQITTDSQLASAKASGATIVVVYGGNWSLYHV